MDVTLVTAEHRQCRIIPWLHPPRRCRTIVRIMAACASCLLPLPERARFCPSCGHEVVTVAAEERRVVTVVFADLVGYSSLSEHLDPERVKRLLDAAFERLIADINAFGGRIDKVLGDGIVALFGAPVAHEDDADRAIRASISMHSTLATFVHDQPDLDAPLQLRIGINTGEVLVGAVSGTADYTAMGDVVNVAARLQALAPPGGIYIGDATAALTSGEIIREVVDDLEVRGRVRTERVWRVLGRQRRLPAVGARRDVPFVGRSTQRELLASIMTMVAGGRSAVVSVTGEAGSGKTRLISEALEDFPNRSVTIYAGVCAPYGEHNVWSPIATALLRRLDVAAGIPPDDLRRLVRERGVELYGFEADDPQLGVFVEATLHLIGLPSELDQLPPAQAREALFSYIVEGLRRRSRAGPIVMWIDDLQWADPLIIDLLHRMARSLADRPVLIITAQRDDAEFEWPPAVDHPITVRMPLDPLEREEAGRLVTQLLGGLATPPLIDRLYDRSGGNPLFLIELTELSKSNPDSEALPGSLRALIAARLDRLPLAQRAIVDNAAVLGTSGPLVALEHFAGEMDQEFDPDDVQALVDEGLIEIEGANWQFRSDVVRDVAYQTLTKLVRAQRHAGTATVMAQLPMAPLDQVAHHAACAAELVAEIGPVPGVTSTIAEQAVLLLRDAARRAIDTGAFNQASRHATRALDLGIHDDRLGRELLLLRAQAQAERRAGESARADSLDALEASLAAGDERHEALARRLLGVLHQRDGNLPAARDELGRSVELFRGLGDDIELAASLRERGFAEVFGGSLEDAEWLLGEAEALSERLEDRRGLAWVRQHQAWVAFLSGDSDLAEERLMAAAQEFDLLGDRAGRGWASGLLAYVRYYQMRLEEAEALATAVRAEALALGDPWAPAMMDSLVASIRLWTSRFVEAEDLSRRALSSFRQIGDRFGAVLALGPRVRSLVALGRTNEAERGMEEALAIGDAFGDLAFPAMAAAGVAVHMGIGERSVTIAESAVDRLAAMGAEAAESRVTLALALCQAGRADEALALLDGHDLGWPYAASVAALAAALTGDGEGALAAARTVDEVPGATYLDRLYASVAAATAELVAGNREEGEEWLLRADVIARESGDVVARAIATAARRRLADGLPVDDVDHLGPGWRRVLDGLAGTIPPSASRPPAVVEPA
jgi:class 3 adenylate cyclase/tetratricopeptide (TPR) repeat protein